MGKRCRFHYRTNWRNDPFLRLCTREGLNLKSCGRLKIGKPPKSPRFSPSAVLYTRDTTNVPRQQISARPWLKSCKNIFVPCLVQLPSGPDQLRKKGLPLPVSIFACPPFENQCIIEAGP